MFSTDSSWNETKQSQRTAFCDAFTCDIACPPRGSLDPSDEKQEKMTLFKRNCWQRVPKNIMLYSLLSPFCVISPVYFVLGVAFPMYAHYFIIIASIHAGYCLPDFLFAWKLLKAPKSCIIDQAQDEFDILVDQTSSSWGF